MAMSYAPKRFSKMQRVLAHACRGRMLVEELESRTLLSTTPTLGQIKAALPAGTPVKLTPAGLEIQPIPAAAGSSTPAYSLLDPNPQLTPNGTLAPFQFATPPAGGYTPSQIRSAYGVDTVDFNGVTGDGTGQTIAIVDAYDLPTAAFDLHNFDVAMGLPDTTFIKINQRGGSVPPLVSPQGDWEVEEALDIEWAHALAPGATIVLVEADDNSNANLYAAVDLARNLAGVSVVSMSFGTFGDFPGETAIDPTFTTPAGHNGVTFLAATGDDGAPGGYPAFSPNVVAVGGTTLTVDPNGGYGGEVGWSGSGGGISKIEPEPLYQRAVVKQTFTNRATPDVAFDADPATGVVVYDSYSFGSSTPWDIIGGTSLACPCWAGLIAVANQGRDLAGAGTLDGPSQTLPILYSMAASNFHDITSGGNGFAAGVGYDLVTGRGTPNAVPVLQSLAGIFQLVYTQQPTHTFPHHAISPAITVTLEDQFGNIDTGSASSVTLAVGSGPGTISGTLTVGLVNGVATFSNVALSAAGTYVLTASDAGDGVGATDSDVFTVGDAPNQLVFSTQPGTSTAGLPITGPVTVKIEYSNGTVVSTDSSITLSVFSGPGALTGTITVPAVNGVATFSGAMLNIAGTYMLAAADPIDLLSNYTSNSFLVQAGAATQIAVLQQPTTSVAGVIAPVVVGVEDAFGNVVTTKTSSITISTATGPGTVGGTNTLNASGGIATFSNLIITTAGNYTLTVNDTTDHFTVTSAIFLVNPAAAVHLAFLQAPSNITAGQAFSPTVTALLTDQFGNTATTDLSNITIATATGPGGVVGTATVQASNGIATFSNITINKSGTYTLMVTGTGMTSATSGSFDVVNGPAVQLVFVQQPSAIPAGSNFAVVLQVEDAAGNFLPTSNAAARMSIVGGPLGGKLAGTINANAVNGIVTINALSINNSTGNFTIGATLPGAITNYSAPIAVTAAPVKLAFTQQPQLTVNAGKPISAVTAQLLDATGHRSAANLPVTISLSNANGAVLGGVKTVTSVNGLVTFSNLTISKPGTYTLTVSSGKLQPATTRSITVQPAGTLLTTTTSLTSSSAVPVVGKSLTLTAAVAAAGALLGRTGTITFFDGSTRLGTVSLNANSAASLTFTPSSTGVHNFKAVYSGDSTYKTSTGLLAQTVQSNPLAPLVKAAAKKKAVNTSLALLRIR